MRLISRSVISGYEADRWRALRINMVAFLSLIYKQNCNMYERIARCGSADIREPKLARCYIPYPQLRGMIHARLPIVSSDHFDEGSYPFQPFLDIVTITCKVSNFKSKEQAWYYLSIDLSSAERRYYSIYLSRGFCIYTIIE